MGYRQYCGLARSLEVVGDRWTLLIVRELLAGQSRYRELQSGLPGIASNLLADRLRRLEADGLVTRHDASYVLTSRGHALRPVIHELIRWAEPLMVSGQGDDHFDGTWLLVALEALVRPAAEGCLDIHTGGAVLHLRVSESGVDVHSGAGPDADAALEADGEVVLGIVTGHLGLRDAVDRQLAIVDGDLGLVSAILEPTTAAPARERGPG